MSNKKLLINLAKDLDFETEMEYFDYIIDSMYNGQPQQVKRLYNDMKPCDRKEFVTWILSDVHTSDELIIDKLLKTIGVTA